MFSASLKGMRKLADRIRSGLGGRLSSRLPPGMPPPIVEDPLEALFESRGGRQTSFHCPLEQCTHFVGFGLSPGGWHPFVSTLLEYRRGLVDRYEDSLLRAFYEDWQPQSAAEAFAGFQSSPPALHELPPYCFYLTPWTAMSAGEITLDVRYWSARENEEHGDGGLDFLKHGLGYFGPTDPRKGRTELRRLTEVHDSLLREGYDRRYGDVTVWMLERAGDHRFVVDGGGYHRAAAAAAAGQSTVPARLRGLFLIRAEDAAYWPQIRRGVWSREAAVRYFHHLFDFDARGWAQERGLLPEQRHDSLTWTPA